MEFTDISLCSDIDDASAEVRNIYETIAKLVGDDGFILLRLHGNETENISNVPLKIQIRELLTAAEFNTKQLMLESSESDAVH